MQVVVGMEMYMYLQGSKAKYGLTELHIVTMGHKQKWMIFLLQKAKKSKFKT